MPEKLRAETMNVVRAFYRKLDVHKKVFDIYFAPESKQEDKKKEDKPKPAGDGVKPD